MQPHIGVEFFGDEPHILAKMEHQEEAIGHDQNHDKQRWINNPLPAPDSAFEHISKAFKRLWGQIDLRCMQMILTTLTHIRKSGKFFPRFSRPIFLP